ncbi:MAG TPA: glycosyltransferase [Acidimicrobiales bacterium]|nr:glycosyltransferase [Acidimicrobiales bacterium]
MADAAPPVICCAAVAEQLPAARALDDAVAKVYPGERLRLLLVEREPSSALRGAGVVAASLASLASEADVHEFVACAEGPDLAAALAPAFVATLLASEPGRPVCYLAPEVALLGALEALVAPLDRHPATLVARLLAPVPEDGRTPSPAEVAAAGAFDPGIVAVAPGERGAAFAAWWLAAMRRAVAQEGAQPSRGAPFLDLAPGALGAAVLRDPGHGIAYWNAAERGLELAADSSVTAQGRPVRTVHFAGFDPNQAHLLSTWAGSRPRALASANRAIAQLCRERRAALAAHAGAPAGNPPPGERLGDGARLTAAMRRCYRSALARALDEGGEHPPDPFDDAGPARFYAFLASADPTDHEMPVLPRFLAELHRRRIDLRWHFPRVGTVDAAAFRVWVEQHGLAEERVPRGLADALAATPWWRAPTGVVCAPPGDLAAGVAVAGYLHADVGLGEVARRTLEALEARGVATSAVPLGRTEAGSARRASAALGRADRRINVVFVSADQFLGFASVVGPEFFEGRYTVGAWVYETEQLGVGMARHAALVDEIWVPSSHVRRAVEPFVDRAVHTVPYPVDAPPVDRDFDPARLRIDRPYLLFAFDFLSCVRRKNPFGVLAAFRRAFRPGEGPLLVLKSVNGARRPGELEALLLAASDHPDVRVVDAHLEAAERGALLAGALAFVSLHRAEGFGMAMAESMALGRPVVATAYSGNLDFMDAQTAYLVPAARVPVGEGAPPYDPDDTWAEPDLEAAAEALRRIWAAPEEAEAVGRRARERVLERVGVERVGELLAARIASIEQLRRRGYRSKVPAALRRML